MLPLVNFMAMKHIENPNETQKFLLVFMELSYPMKMYFIGLSWVIYSHFSEYL